MAPRTLLVNFKNYTEILGEGGVRLAQASAKVQRATGVRFIVAPPIPTLQAVASAVKIPVFSQKAEAGEQGKSTGAIIPESIRAAGGVGSLLNHSESRIGFELIAEMIPRMRSLGLESCVCAQTAPEAEELARLQPDMLAVEPPELIGTGVAVSKARPELITESARAVERARFDGTLLCGAGVVSGEDVRAAIRLGTEGILVASSVVKAKDWEAKLTELALAMA
jgi:triosephosphate isomerase (TIM)